MSNSTTPRRARSGCPLCGAPVAEKHSPFCSQGCRDRDLLNWLGEGYRVPGRAADPEQSDFDTDGLDSPGTPSL